MPSVAQKLELAFVDTVKSNDVLKGVKDMRTGCWKH